MCRRGRAFRRYQYRSAKRRAMRQLRTFDWYYYIELDGTVCEPTLKELGIRANTNRDKYRCFYCDDVLRRRHVHPNPAEWVWDETGLDEFYFRPAPGARRGHKRQRSPHERIYDACNRAWVERNGWEANHARFRAIAKVLQQEHELKKEAAKRQAAALRQLREEKMRRRIQHAISRRRQLRSTNRHQRRCFVDARPRGMHHRGGTRHH